MQDRIRDEIEQAAAGGARLVDIHTHFDPGFIDGARWFIELLEEIDGFCRLGDLTTSPAPPDVAALRRWFVDEASSQLLEHHAPRSVPPLGD